MLWSPDKAVWDAVAPILFPVVGWTRGGSVRIDGQTHRLGLHGFARSRTFQVTGNASDRVELTDRADARTRRLYPFDYRLSITVELGPRTLRVVATVTNDGDRPMPYAFGLHPGFRWPAGARARVLFDETEAPAVPVITADGLFSAERRELPLRGRELDLTQDLLSREALCFLGIRSCGVTYQAEGFGRLRIDHADFPHLALWSRPPAPFLCIESWTGYGDPADFVGELRDKPSIRLLTPGADAQHAATYTFDPD